MCPDYRFGNIQAGWRQEKNVSAVTSEAALVLRTDTGCLLTSAGVSDSTGALNVITLSVSDCWGEFHWSEYPKNFEVAVQSDFSLLR